MKFQISRNDDGRWFDVEGNFSIALTARDATSILGFDIKVGQTFDVVGMIVQPADKKTAKAIQNVIQD